MEAELIGAERRPKGNAYNDFEVGQVFDHHWGRTINASDNSLFSTLTLHFNPLYFNEPYARAHDHPGIVVNPMLVFSVTFGLSVEDLSEGGGLFLGVEELTFHLPVYEGDTISARSTVRSLRVSGSRENTGICTWHTQGFNQKDERVIDFLRSNLSPIGAAG